MRELSQSRKDRIVDLLFCGKTYREIIAEEDVSIGWVSKVYKQFVGAAEESSLGEAATKYGVEETVGGLLELARECADKRVPVKNLLSAVRLIRFMESRRLKASQLEDCLKICVTSTVTTGKVTLRRRLNCGSWNVKHGKATETSWTSTQLS